MAIGAGRVGLGLAVASLAAPAWAQTPPAGSGWTFEASAALAGASVDEDSPLAPAADGFLADGDLVIRREDVLANGLQLGWRFEGKVQRDAASRPAFIGVLGACDPATPGCPVAIDGAVRRTAVSPTTGLAGFGTRPDDDVVAALEGASLSLGGPWGEGIVGVDSGVAARLDARAPMVLHSVSAFSPSLDPTGLVIARARNDVAGPAFKLSYMSPRLLGLRLGASWTPRPSQRSVDFDPRPDLPGVAQADLQDVFEAALSFARTDRASGLRIRAALTGSWADSSGPYAEFGRYEALGGGLELEQGAWTAGLRYLHSNNAWRPKGGDYQATELSLVRQGDKWRLGAEIAWAEDDLNRQEGMSWLVGARRAVNEKVDVGVAWTSAEADLPLSSATGFGRINARNGGLIIELSVHN